MPCTTILVGKKATFDGSTMVARNDDGAFKAKGTIVIERNKAKAKYQTVLSKCKIDLPDFNYRYTSHPNVGETARKTGLWPAAGINEYNVAMNATETITSNPLAESADPLVEYKKIGKKEIPGGIGEEDLVTLVLPYIKTAREGVIRLGELLEKYGTYERNGLAFNDENEIWWLETIGGHHYIARKVKDDEIVIMANQFGLDDFDFEDALGAQENYMCSKDLLDFVKDNNLYLGDDLKHFNPRLAFGSHTDQDHVYNTPRTWYLLSYFAPSIQKEKNYNPLSDDIPYSFKPDHKVTIQEIKYILSSYYQGTEYNPYGKEAEHGKYRSIGVPNTDVCSLQQVRTNVPDAIKGLEWCSFGGSAFTCMFPIYTNVTKLPEFLSKVTEDCSTESMYWCSRLIAALTDANFGKSVIFTERYQYSVLTKTYAVVREYDKKFIETNDVKLLEKANNEILKIVKEETQKTLNQVLLVASNNMKTRYNREDN